MANWYIGKLAVALSEYDNSSFSIEHYEALAWQGLDVSPNNGHPITQQWNNMTPSQRQNIIDLRNELLDATALNCN